MSDADVFASSQEAEVEEVVTTAEKENASQNKENVAGQQNGRANSGKRRRFGIAFPDDGIWPHCNKKSSKPNWMRRLSMLYPEVIKEHESAVSTQSSSISSGIQQTLNVVPAGGPSKIARYLALYAATTTMSLFHIENNYLKKVPHLKILDRRALAKQIDSELAEMQSAISSYLAESEYSYSFTVDISTTKGMLLSFLGVTAHVFAVTKRCIKAFGLEMTQLTEKHTGEYVYKVFQEVLTKHKLSTQRTLRIVTDCGSNVISAFH